MGEFVARLGLIALNNSVISGSLTVTGGITGSFQGTASFASTASNVLGGATNYIPLWNGATSLSSSVLYQSSGNIGIGATSNLNPLTVYNPTQNTTVLEVRGGGGSSQSRLVLSYGDPTTTTQNALIFANTSEFSLRASNNRVLSFYTNDGSETERMRITPSGSVGIGTTSPAQKLDVAGYAIAGVTDRTLIGQDGTYSGYSTVGFGGVGNGSNRVFGSTTTADGLYLAAATGRGIRFRVNGTDTDNMIISSAGNVGIGTTPRAALDVVGNIITDWNDRFIGTQFTDGSGYAFGIKTITNDRELQVIAKSGGGPNGNGITLYTGGTPSERVRVTYDGNVGIGTTSPSYTLDVSGSIRSTSNAYFATSAGSVGIGTTNPLGAFGINSGTGVVGFNVGSISSPTRGNLFYDTDGTGWKFSIGKYQSSTYTAQMTFQDNGNIGIGTSSPSARLHVSGSTTTNLLVGTSDLFVSASGNVGIGTTSPTYQFHATSTGYFGGTLTLGGGSRLSAVSGNGLNLNTNGSDRLTIDTSGNVGIGTTSPVGDGTALNIYGSSYATIKLQNSTMGSSATDGVDIQVVSSDLLVKNREAGSNIFYTSNSERMRIGSDGNIGIGLTAAGQSGFRTIEIGGSGVSGLIDVYQGTSRQLRIYNSGTDSYLANNTNGGNLLIRTTTSGGTQNDNLIITSTGNVGIGTTSPNAKLEVSGNLYLSNNTSVLAIGNNTALNPYLQGDTSNTLYLGTSGSARIAVLTSGNVGIGTTSPSSKLEVLDGDISVSTLNTFSFFNTNRNTIPASAGTSLGGIRYRGYSTGTTYQVGAQILAYSSLAWNSASTPGYISFQTTPSGSVTLSERMVIDASGNVGIGTTSPASTLDVRGVVEAGTGTIRTVLSYTGTGGVVGTLSNHPLIFYANNDERARITAAGNVGIGTTSPGAKLEVTDGFIKISDSYAYYWGAGSTLITGNSNANTLALSTNNTQRLNINSAGDVGINTTSPTAKLHVNGNTLITGSLTVGQTATGSNENTLTVGLPLGGGTGEGGQILLAASGGLYTTASMLDNYQNKFRVLRGTNAGSDAYKLQLDMHTGQMQLPNYNSSTAFTGTAVADLAVDSNGNIITIATGGGGGSVTINNNTDNYLITATGTANTLNGEANLQFNGSALTITGSLTVITGSAIELQVTNTGVNIGNALTDNHNITGSLNINGNINGAEPIPAGAKLYLFYNY